MRTIKPVPLPGFPTPDVQPWETAHQKIARETAAEGFVLLKNEGGLLPLRKGCKVGLYGVGAVNTIKGGTGSGDMNERYSVSIEEGLENAGFVLTSKAWLAQAAKAYEDARQAWRQAILDDLKQSGDRFFFVYSRHAFSVPSGGRIPEDREAEAGVYVVSRICGEGADRNAAPGDY